MKLGNLFSFSNEINEPGLALDSSLWQKLEGGYRIKYDASIPLRALEKASDIKAVDTIYKELWNELHHQGDLGLASYYAVPHLVRIAKETKLFDWNTFGLVALIGLRSYKNNPAIPKALVPQYNQAFSDLVDLALKNKDENWDLSLTNSILTLIALVKGQVKLASAIFELDDDDRIDEFLANFS